MKKLLLLMTLFLGSCTLIDTPSDELIRLIGGRTGTYRYDSIDYKFYIRSDATSYTEYDKYGVTADLEYTDGGDDWATYEGTVYIEDVWGNIYKYDALVELYDIGYYTGMRDLYLNGTLTERTGFSLSY